MLSRETMQKLEVGQRVEFSDGVRGTVVSTNKYCVVVEWEDGQSGYISVEDGQQISLVELEEVA